MQTTTRSNFTTTRGVIEAMSMTFEDAPRLAHCARENVRLAQENEHLRRLTSDLTTAAETWIRLYEAALDRANAAEGRLARGGAAGA